MAEVRMHMKGSPQDVDIDYALLRGNTGFYATGILSHPTTYPAWNGGGVARERLCRYDLQLAER